MLDSMDQHNVDTDVSPRFGCENCFGKMEPVYYIGINGKIYKFDES